MKDVVSGKRYPFSMDALYCGLDVHKMSTYATVVNLLSEVKVQKRVSNDEVLVFIEPFRVGKVAMEASTYVVRE